MWTSGPGCDSSHLKDTPKQSKRDAFCRSSFPLLYLVGVQCEVFRKTTSSQISLIRWNLSLPGFLLTSCRRPSFAMNFSLKHKQNSASSISFVKDKLVLISRAIWAWGMIVFPIWDLYQASTLLDTLGLVWGIYRFWAGGPPSRRVLVQVQRGSVCSSQTFNLMLLDL